MGIDSISIGYDSNLIEFDHGITVTIKPPSNKTMKTETNKKNLLLRFVFPCFI